MLILQKFIFFNFSLFTISLSVVDKILFLELKFIFPPIQSSLFCSKPIRDFSLYNAELKSFELFKELIFLLIFKSLNTCRLGSKQKIFPFLPILKHY